MAGSISNQVSDVRFGRTVLSVAVGELVDQPVEAIVTAGNQRGMFAAGAAGTLWSAAGEDVERELRSRAPLEIGTAVATGSGHLQASGIGTIIHAIVASGLGERPRQLAVPRAMEAAFSQAVDRRVRSLAFPLIGIGESADPAVRLERAEIILETLISVLRTRSHRIERGILVTRFEDDRIPLATAIGRARERLWTT